MVPLNLILVAKYKKKIILPLTQNIYSYFWVYEFIPNQII